MTKISKYPKTFRILIRLPRFIISYLSNYKIVPKPWAFTWEVTYRCNLKCKYCDRWRTAARMFEAELTTKEAKKMIDEAYDLGVGVMIFTGGEPLLRKDIFELAKYAKNKGIECQLPSNGTLITGKNIKEIVNCFDSINISLDSMDPQIHDNLRGVKGSFEKAVNALDLLSKYKTDGRFGIQATVTKDNFCDITKLIKFAEEKNCRVLLQPVNDVTDTLPRIYDKQILDFDFEKLKREWSNVLDNFDYKAMGYRSRYSDFLKDFPLFLERPEEVKHKFICFAGTHNFFVDPYGDVFVCESIRKSQGNIKEKSLKEIWKDMTNFRREISSKDRECICWYNCAAKDYLVLTRFVRIFKKGTKQNENLATTSFKRSRGF